MLMNVRGVRMSAIRSRVLIGHSLCTLISVRVAEAMSDASRTKPQNRGMTLAGFLIAGPVAHSHALWRNPDHPVPFLSTEYYVEIARILERGRFDLIFFADRLAIADRYGNDKTIGIRHGDQDSTRMDPMPIL